MTVPRLPAKAATRPPPKPQGICSTDSRSTKMVGDSIRNELMDRNHDGIRAGDGSGPKIGPALVRAGHQVECR